MATTRNSKVALRKGKKFVVPEKAVEALGLPEGTAVKVHAYDDERVWLARPHDEDDGFDLLCTDKKTYNLIANNQPKDA